MTFFAQVVFDPCAGLEEGSWLWWLRGCWILPDTAMTAFTIVGAASLVSYGVYRVMVSRGWL